MCGVSYLLCAFFRTLRSPLSAQRCSQGGSVKSTRFSILATRMVSQMKMEVLFDARIAGRIAKRITGHIAERISDGNSSVAASGASRGCFGGASWALRGRTATSWCNLPPRTIYDTSVARRRVLSVLRPLIVHQARSTLDDVIRHPSVRTPGMTGSSVDGVLLTRARRA